MYYAFDILVYGGVDVMKWPLWQRRELLASVLPAHQNLSLSQHTTGPVAEILVL